MLRIPFAAAILSALSFIAGCSGGSTPAKIITPPPATAQLTISPSTSLTFASTTIGTMSAPQVLTLTNTGTATLTLSGDTLTGAVTDFSSTSTCGKSLAPAATCTFTIVFKPQTTGTLTATITVTDNASNSPQTVTLTGTGVVPPGPQAALTPSPGLAFPNTPVGQTSAPLTLTLTNTGTTPLEVGGYTLTGAAVDFTVTTTCAKSLPVSSSCTYAVVFAPLSAGPLTATIAVADNAPNQPQTATLTGTGTGPQATLTPAILNFPSTPSGSTSAALTAVLANTGTSPLAIAGIALGGANSANFSETNSCSATLVAGASCPISVTFSPSAVANYTAMLTITDNSDSVSGATQSAVLNGSAASRTLYVFPETDNSVTPLYTLVNNAQSTVDMTMYELQDATFLNDMVADCTRGVRVRVILDASLEMTSNTPAYNQLNTSGANCSAVFSNTAFQATHQKTITVDGTTTAILTLNLQTKYYSTSRDFALVENDTADIAAIEATFNADYAAGTPYGGTQGPSDLTYQPGLGDDLIWSPTTAQTAMLGLINNAKTSLLIENEEMGASNIVSALETACQNGVTVHITMVEDSTSPPYSTYSSELLALERAGCGVHVYPDTSTGLYIHAKAVVADYGLSTQNVYMGSINYSIASMTENRELGLYLSDPAAVTSLNTTMAADYAGGSVFTGGGVDPNPAR